MKILNLFWVLVILFINQINAQEINTKTQTISKNESRASYSASDKYFTGSARVDPLFPKTDAKTHHAAYVTFEPGARSHWHTHPAGQHMIVTSGVGYTQVWGEPIKIIKAGDVIWCPPNVKHWHGASKDIAMTHIAISGVKNGKTVEWLGKVTDKQYNSEVK